MHIAAKSPIVVNPSDLSTRARNDELEKTIADTKMLDAKTKLNAISKANQRINEQYCLLSQRYAKDPERTVEELLQEVSSALDINFEVVRFIRWQTNQSWPGLHAEFIRKSPVFFCRLTHQPAF